MSCDWEPFYARLQKVIHEGDGDDNDQQCLPLQTEKTNHILKIVSEYLQNNQELNCTIEMLKADNQRLANKFNYEKQKCRSLQQKLKTIVKNQDLFMKMKEEYQAMLTSVKERTVNKEANKSTSINNYVPTREKSAQINVECQPCLTKNNLDIICHSDLSHGNKSVACQVIQSEYYNIPRGEVDRLQFDINTLKELLNAREMIWGKLATRERIQRLQLNRLHDQLEDLHKLEFKQRVELELKNKTLQELTRELEHERLEVRKLKKHSGKLNDTEKVSHQQRDSQKQSNTISTQEEHGELLLS